MSHVTALAMTLALGAVTISKSYISDSEATTPTLIALVAGNELLAIATLYFVFI